MGGRPIAEEKHSAKAVSQGGRPLRALTILIAAAIFAADLALPLGVAGAVPYVAVVLLAARLPWAREVLIFALGCSLLTMLGLFLSPPAGDAEAWKVLANRGLALGVIWATAILRLQHRRAEHSAAESRARSAAMLDSAEDGIIMIDESGTIESANPAALRLFGYEASELISQNIRVLMPSAFADEYDRYLEDYLRTIKRAKERGLPVLLGLEVDFSPESYGRVLEFLDGYDFDFLIGSVHWIDGWMFDRSAAVPEIRARGARRLFEEYFDVKTRLAARGGVDVLAHTDRCKTMGIVPDEEPLDLYESLVEAASASGLAIEVSSGGLRQAVGEIYPAPTLLRLFREAGVPITLASDAHYPEQAGSGHDEVVAAARAAGYTEYLRFEQRRRTRMELPDR